MALKDNCHKLKPLETPIGDIVQEINNAIQDNEEIKPADNPTEIVTDNSERKQERILVSRQELRRNAYIQQLVTDGKNAVKNISNLKVDLDNLAADSIKEAREIMTGTESEIMTKLRAALSTTITTEPELNKYLEYVKSLL